MKQKLLLKNRPSILTSAAVIADALFLKLFLMQVRTSPHLSASAPIKRKASADNRNNVFFILPI